MQAQCGQRHKTWTDGFVWECHREKGHPLGPASYERNAYGHIVNIKQSEGHWFRVVKEEGQ